jgi:adenylate cyclase
VADVGDAQSIVGTEGYIAPEGPGTPQADLYALGKVFYEMAMGRDRRDFPNLPGDLESLPDRKALMEFNEIVARACARHADGRYHTAGELLADLRRLQVGESIRHRHSVEQAMGRARRLAPAVGLIALLVLALPIIWRRQQTPRAPLTEKASVFVLPFRTGETNPPTSVGDLRGRITDALIDSLALIEGVRVGPRKSGWISTSEVELRSRLRRPPYNFGQVLTGQTRSTGDTVTFTLCLYDAPKDQPGWTQAYSGKASNLIGLERQAVANVAARLGLKVTEAEQRQIDTKLTNNLKARELLERGRAVWSDGNRDAISKAKEDFLRVVELDPWFLDAYSGLISADREFLGIDRRAAEGWPRIKMTAQRMLQIDDTAFDGQYWSAYAKMFYDWDWEGAKADFERLIPLLNHRDRALYYRCLGRTKEAQIEQELMERENPTDVVSRCYHYLSARFAERRYDDCIAEAARSRELYPKNPWPYFFKARAATEKGDYRLALETLQSLRQFNDMPDLIALEGRAHALMGEREKAREGLRQLQQLAGQTYVVPYCKAWVHAALGDKDDALKDLEAAVADRAEQLVDADYGGLRTDPAWDVLQNEAKFHDLLKATGLNVWPK